MDSATYNEKPDDPTDRDAWRHGSYMPQHKEAAPGAHPPSRQCIHLASLDVEHHRPLQFP